MGAAGQLAKPQAGTTRTAPFTLRAAQGDRPVHRVARKPAGHLAMAWSGQRRASPQGMVFVGGPESARAIPKVSANYQGSLGWHSCILSEPSNLRSDRSHQRHHSNRQTPRERIPQLPKSPSYLLLDGWPPHPSHPVPLCPYNLAKRQINALPALSAGVVTFGSLREQA